MDAASVQALIAQAVSSAVAAAVQPLQAEVVELKQQLAGVNQPIETLNSVAAIVAPEATHSFKQAQLLALPAGRVNRGNIPLARDENLARDLKNAKGESLTHEAPFVATYLALAALMLAWGRTFTAALNRMVAANALPAATAAPLLAALTTLQYLHDWLEAVAAGRLTELQAFLKDGHAGITAMHDRLFGASLQYTFNDLPAVQQTIDARSRAVAKAAATAAASKLVPAAAPPSSNSQQVATGSRDGRPFVHRAAPAAAAALGASSSGAQP